MGQELRQESIRIINVIFSKTLLSDTNPEEWVDSAVRDSGRGDFVSRGLCHGLCLGIKV